MSDISIYSKTTLRWAVGLNEPMRRPLRLLKIIAVGKLARMRTAALAAALDVPAEDETSEFLRQVSLGYRQRRGLLNGAASTGAAAPDVPEKLIIQPDQAKIAAFTMG